MEQAALVAQQFPDDQPPPAANPTPTYAAPLSSHPSYVEMITAAIQWGSLQGKEAGSSKRAIAKYIDRVYTNLPPSHSALLTHHLKRLKSAGILAMIKNSYQLSSAILPSSPTPRSTSAAAPLSPAAVSTAFSAVPVSVGPASASTGVKRGPGRPPKLKEVMAVSSDPVVDNGSGSVFMSGSGYGSGSGSEPGKKRRGRPPKQQGAVATEVPFVQPISEVPPSLVNGEAAMTPPSTQKRRGRPPKEKPPVVPFAPQPLSEVHPVVLANDEVVVAGMVPKRRPGRPPKENVGGTGSPESRVGSVGRPRGRPRKNDVLGPVMSHVGKRSRGRPIKIGAGFGGVGMGMLAMRRGRPPKGSGPPKMVRRRTGRPVGRPRKDASVSIIHTSDQEWMANEELMNKFELIQTKIREAVVIIRPCVANQDAALTALQQLEELTTVDLNAPPTAPPPPPSPPPPPPPPTTTTTMMSMPQSMSAQPTPAVPISIAPVSTLPTQTVTAPFMAAPPPFNVTVSQMTGVDGQHPMNWFPSNEAQS